MINIFYHLSFLKFINFLIAYLVICTGNCGHSKALSDELGRLNRKKGGKIVASFRFFRFAEIVLVCLYSSKIVCKCRV